VLLDFHSEGQHTLEAPKRPRHSIRRRLSAQGVANVDPSPKPGQHDGEIHEARVNHLSSLPFPAPAIIRFEGPVAFDVVDMREFLGMQRVTDTTWRFHVTDRLITPGQFLFGGCGLAAGVTALEEASGRPTIYAAAHYLSFAPFESDVDVVVDLAVQGHRVTQARATASVDGREVLTVNAALGTGELASPTPWLLMPDVPAPEDCRKRQMPSRYDNSIFNYVETRIALGRSFDELDGTSGSPISALWVRVPSHLEPSAATLAIFGDFVAGGASQPLGQNTMGRSLDNTIRIATLVPTEWVLVETHMHALSGGFAQGTGYLWSRDGVLLGTASQSMSSKFWDPPAK
jgi:acyl-CoA thioesterase II